MALSAPEAGDEWLGLPGFVRWWVEGNALHLAFADEETVRRIAADHHYLILSGLSPATFAPGEGLTARELAAQMSSLAEGGATLHLELGGAAPEETIASLAEAIDGLVSSAGINENELALLISLSDFCVLFDGVYPEQSRRAKDRPVSLHKSAVFQRCQRAVALAQRRPILEATPPFAISLRGLAVTADGAILIGVDDSPVLHRLRRAVEAIPGVSPPRSYPPHVTIGQVLAPCGLTEGFQQTMSYLRVW